MEEQKPEEHSLEEDIEQVEQAPEPQSEPVRHEQKSELPKNLVKQPSRIARFIPETIGKLKSFWIECKRVLRVTKKPDKQEFMTIVKISAIGMGVIGIIGFLIHFVKELLL